MALLTQQKAALLKKYRRSELDTGSPEVQVALMSERIGRLTEHFKAFPKDNHSRQGLFRLVSQRRKLLDYLRRKDAGAYTKLIESLGLRK